MRWVTCPACGRELPQTYFPVIAATGRKSELCASCRRRVLQARRATGGAKGAE